MLFYRVRMFLSLIVLTTLMACGQGENEQVEPIKSGDEAVNDSAQGGDSPGEAEAELPAKVGIKFSVNGETPDRVIAQLDRPIFSELWGQDTYRTQKELRLPEGSVLSISPEILGTWTLISSSALAFTPSTPFEPATDYQISITSLLDQDEKEYTPQDPKQWQYEFKSAAFSYVASEVVESNPEKNRVSVQMEFTYKVDPKQVQKLSKWTLGKRAIKQVRVEPSMLGSRFVLVTLMDRRLAQPEDKLKLVMKSGVAMADDKAVVLGEVNYEVKLSYGQPWKVVTVGRLESAAGHYLQLVCDDTASEGERRYWWSSELGDSFRIRRGCALTAEEAESQISFEPEVPFYVASSTNGIRIFGEFEQGSYVMKIPAGTKTALQSVLRATFEKNIQIPPRQPALNFVHSGRYLPSDAWKGLSIRHRNIDDVQVSIRHIPKENLVFWLSGEYEEADGRTSNLVYDGKIPLKNEPDVLMTSYLDVRSMVPNPDRGVYQISIYGDGSSSTARLLLTDMNIVAKVPQVGAKQSWADEMWLWALNSDTGEGIAGATLRVVRMSGQNMGECQTDAKGGCRVELMSSKVSNHGPFAVIASKGDDVTYLKFDDLLTPTSNFDVQGVDSASTQKYRASLFADRGVYRPGDSAYLTAILRGVENQAPKKGMPVELQLLDPRGQTLKTLKLKTNGAGLVSTKVHFEDYASTGRYQATLKVADSVIQRLLFSVEEFVPERMKVDVQAQKEDYLTSDPAVFDVEATYLFGGVASGNPVELTCYLERNSFQPKGFETYSFSVWSDPEAGGRSIELGTVAGELGEDGRVSLACPKSSAGVSLDGPTRVSAKVAVFEAGSGRSTKGTASTRSHPAEYYIGLKSSTELAKSGEDIKVDGVIVDWNGRYLTEITKLQARLSHLEAEYVWGYREDGSNYRRYLHAVPEGRLEVPVKAGKFSLSASPGAANDGYLIELSDGVTRTNLMVPGSGRYYWWGYDGDEDSKTPKPSRPSEIALKTSGLGLVGTPILVKFNAPYKGRVLMTAESDTVLASEWLDVEAGETTWAFAPQNFIPNIYFSALLVKDPHLDSAEAYKPERSFGVTSFAMSPEDFDLGLKLKAQEVTGSNSELLVDVSVEKGGEDTYVVLAAVDEGILSLTNHKSPNPFKSIFAKTALGVSTYETVGWTLLVPPGGPSSEHGGGDGANPAGRVQPVKPVALWSGVVKIPASGKVQVRFSVPQYRGQLRVMAVAASPSLMGHASAKVTVRDPITLQTTLPRFLTYGDEIQIPVFLTNMSGKAQKISVTLDSDLLDDAALTDMMDAVVPLTFIGKRTGTLTLEDGESGTAVFHARANLQVGAAKLRVQAKAGNLVFFDELEVPFSPVGPRIRKSQVLKLEDGKTDLSAYVDGWLPTTERTTFWVSGNPYGEAFDKLKYVIRYPYGCVEQTTSSTRPLLYVRNLLNSVDPELVAKHPVEEMVQKGIERLLSMQVPEGGFAYWPGGSEAHPWGTGYATGLLMEAKEQNFPVPQSAIDDALDYLARVSSDDLGRDDSASYSARRTYAAAPYAQYILAKGGKGNPAYCKRRLKSMIKDGKGDSEHAMLLKAALYLSGDRRYEAELRSGQVKVETDNKSYRYDFYSSRRHRALMLSVFQDLFARDSAGEKLAQQVARDLSDRGNRYYNTQEVAWGTSALGRWLDISKAEFEVESLTANRTDVKAVAKNSSDKSADRSFFLARSGEYKKLSLDMDINKGSSAYLLISSEGVPSEGGFEYGGKGLKVVRSYRDGDGELIDPYKDPLELGELIYVHLQVSNFTKGTLNDIALVDRFPAGWEVETPKLSGAESLEWLDGKRIWPVDYFNLRDDRLEAFGSLPSNKGFNVVYQLRAVTAGSFTVPPVSMESMYDASNWARAKGGLTTVTGPWADHLL